MWQLIAHEKTPDSTEVEVRVFFFYLRPDGSWYFAFLSVMNFNSGASWELFTFGKKQEVIVITEGELNKAEPPPEKTLDDLMTERNELAQEIDENEEELYLMRMDLDQLEGRIEYAKKKAAEVAKTIQQIEQCDL